MANKKFESDAVFNGEIQTTKLKVTGPGGDEGGEINLAKASTNTTLVDGVVIDVNQNKLRIFEQGGTNRGVYIDISGAATGVGTNLVGGGSASDSFKTIAVSGQSDVVADSSTDTLNLVAGTNVSITTNATSDSITINSSASLTQEEVQDYVAPLFTHANHINASVTYEDASNELHIDVTNAPTAGYTAVLKHDVRLNGSIAKGQAVYVSSSNGTNMVVSKASNASEATSSKTLGLLETGGANNALVKVVTEGLLAGLDTSTAGTEGDPVWLGTDGNLIYGLTNKPVAPAHLVFIGIVTRKNSNNGEIFVKVQNGFELRELHTVLLESDASIADNEVLAYDTTSGLWKNQTSVEAGLIDTSATAQTKAGNLTIQGTTTVASTINSTGLNLVISNDEVVSLNTLNNSAGISEDTGFTLTTNGALTPKIWLFTNSGNLTFPDSSNQTTAFLGMSSYSTTNLSEGTNLYFTDERAQDAIGNNVGTGLSYNDSTGAISNSGVTSLTGTTNEIVVSGSTGSVTIGIPDSPVFVTPNIGVATATSVNGTTIPSSKTLVVTTDIGSTVQAYDADLGAIAALTGTAGILTTNGAGLWSVITDNSSNWDTAYTDRNKWNGGSSGLDAPTGRTSLGLGTMATQTASDYLTTANASTTYQPKDQDLTDIAALTADGLLKRTSGVWAMDTSTYLTSYTETDTLSSVTGRGATTSTSISITNATASSSYTTGALVVTGGVGIGEDLYVNNDIYVGGDINITGSITGNLTSVDVTNLVVTDPLIYLAEANPNDNVDIGIFAAYNHSNPTKYHTGLIRDASDSGKWKLASNLLDPTSNVIDFTGATFDTLKLGTLEATSVPTVGTITSGTWNGTAIGYAYGGTGLTTLGTAGQVLKVNSGATGLEWGTASGGSSFTNSSELAALISDETGTGLVVFNNSPSLTSPTISGGTINSASIGATTASTGRFTSVNINGQAIMEGSTGTTSATSSFNTTVYSSAEFIIYGSTSTGNYVSKVLMLARGAATPVITEYAILTQGTAPTVTITPSYSAPNAVLTVAVTSGTNIEIIATEVSI